MPKHRGYHHFTTRALFVTVSVTDQANGNQANSRTGLNKRIRSNHSSQNIHIVLILMLQRFIRINLNNCVICADLSGIILVSFEHV